MNRRNFLKNTASASAGVVLANVFNGFGLKALTTSPFGNALLQGTDTDKVLVMIQLGGGNDGLNTVVPLDQLSILNKARPQVILPDSKLLSLSGEDKLALHPALSGVQKLYNDGKVRIIQSVGYPDQSYSHFRSTDIWMTGANADQTLPTGWLGRYLSKEYPYFPTYYPNEEMPDPISIEIGYATSLAFQAPITSRSYAISDPEYFYELADGLSQPTPDTPAGHQLQYVRDISRQSKLYQAVVTKAYTANTNTQTYPQTNLAAQLAIVARLIAGGLKTRLYLVHLDGFDTHDSQVEFDDHTLGEHAQLLQILSSAANAFIKDLSGLGVAERVLTMTFSEFGRRIIGNDSLGTDHGAAAPMFIFGQHVLPGIMGTNPQLPLNPNEDDNLPLQYDFRQVYATILRHWFCIPEAEATNIMLDNYTLLPFIAQSDCVSTNIEEQLPQTTSGGAVALISASPNPFSRQTTIEYISGGGQMLLQVINTTGQVVATLIKKSIASGKHQVIFDSHNLPAGQYYIRLQQGLVNSVIGISKL